MVRGVFFDLGGTLFSYRGSRGGGRMVDEVARRLGIDREREELREAWRSAQDRTAREYAQRPYFLHRDLFRDGLRAFAESMGARPSEDLLAWFETTQRNATVENLPIREDCLPTLRMLKARLVSFDRLQHRRRLPRSTRCAASVGQRPRSLDEFRGRARL